MAEDLSAIYQRFFKGVFSELYEVVRAVDVIMDTNRYRIEILKACHTEPVCYEAHYWIGRDAVQPTTPEEIVTESDGPDGVAILVKHPYVWIRSEDPEIALRHALDFLAGENKL